MRWIFETYFDADYTLKKLSTEAYIRDPRFEAHGAAIKWSKDHHAKWYDEPELRFVLKQEDWSDVFLINHHAQFDSFILSHHYDVHPKMLGCTLSMARLLLGNHLSVSLDAVRKHFGMPLKITPYDLFKGKRWHEISVDRQNQVADGACDEVESIWTLFGKLSEKFPPEEYHVVDTVVKMFTSPSLLADTDLLAKIWEQENDAKHARLAALGVTPADLQSPDRFADLLRDQGLEPATKISPTGAKIYAFAKTDDYMRNLLEDDNDTVVALAEARLGQKSTLMQTRAATLGWMARRGPLPVYLSYAGTGTLRVSGGDKANWLNFKRASPLRQAIMAPEGYLLAPIDSSQIEVRVLQYLAGGRDDPMLSAFREGRDPYAELASRFYGEPIYKPKDGDPRKAEMEAMRGAGKQAILMCGYGAGAPKYRATAKAGLYGPPINLSIEEAERHVQLYRESNAAVCGKNGYWIQASRTLPFLASSIPDPVCAPSKWGLLRLENHRIYLPNGCPLIYDTLEWYRPTPEEKASLREFERNGYWRVKTRRGWKKMWGSKLVQNICEAVSRVIVSQAMNRITAMGYRVLNWPYDELLCLIPKDGKEEWHLARCVNEMKVTPDWLPGIPLDCEAHMGERYLK